MRHSITQAPIFAWYKLFRVRQRYFLTRNNQMRLRYSLPLLAALSLSLSTGGYSLYRGADLSPVIAIASSSDIAPAANLFEVSAVDEDDYFASETESLKSRARAGLPDIRKILKSDGPIAMELEIESGQTVAGLLQDSGVSGAEAHKAVQALAKHANMRKIQAGQTINVRLEPGKASEDEMVLASLSMPLDQVKYVTLDREGSGDFKSALHEKNIQAASRAGQTTIQTSLYGSAARAGIPAPVIAEMIRIYSWDIDFQRDIRRGDKIEVLYNVEETEDGHIVSYGDILYAKLTIGGRDVPLYRFEMENGKIDYFDMSGHSIKKTLMKTPVDGARISSGFGMRKHPVLGYNKMHKGMDFAAAVGTPIYAAGDGTIESIGRNGGYGNYIRVRHNNQLKTAYAHMHKFAKGLKQGSRVQQGQVIGYVGTTGRSTGPHLHYEVLVDNGQVNPRSLDLPVGEQLAGRDLKRFKELANSYDQQYASLSRARALKYAQSAHHRDEEKKKKS